VIGQGKSRKAAEVAEKKETAFFATFTFCFQPLRSLVLCGFFFSLTSCGRGAATASAAPTGADAGIDALEATAGAAPRDPLEEDLWTMAESGELADLARLYDHEGESGLVERASIPAYRKTAIAALGCGDDFTALPFLAGVAISGTDEEARLALESAGSLASMPRRMRDPEDALELRKGCDLLLSLARKTDAPARRRAMAISALRMLVGVCTSATEIPPDLDPK
jgi:hypothetical protein